MQIEDRLLLLVGLLLVCGGIVLADGQEGDDAAAKPSAERRRPQCNNVDIALHIRYVSDYAAIHKNMTAFDEAKMIRRTMEFLHRGKWAAYVITNEQAAGRTVVWSIPGKNFCNMSYRGWYYTVWRVDRHDIPAFEYGLHKIKAVGKGMFKQIIDDGAVFQAG